jgi:hypothetical protein
VSTRGSPAIAVSRVRDDFPGRADSNRDDGSGKSSLTIFISRDLEPHVAGGDPDRIDAQIFRGGRLAHFAGRDVKHRLMQRALDAVTVDVAAGEARFLVRARVLRGVDASRDVVQANGDSACLDGKRFAFRHVTDRRDLDPLPVH